MVPGAWEKVMETLDLLQSFRCPTVIRQTLVPKLNMGNIEGYAELVEEGRAHLRRAKGSDERRIRRRRFAYEEMASYEESGHSASKLSQRTGYNLIDEQYESNIVLLSRLDEANKPLRLKVLNRNHL